LKQLKEVAGNTLEHVGIGNNFLNRIPMAQQLKERLEKWDYIKLKCFCTAKQSLDLRDCPRMGENLCQLFI
jgi:hypothetical protein